MNIKKLFTFISLLLVLSCTNDKEANLKRLNRTVKNIEVAMNSNNEEYIKMVIAEIEYLLPIYDKHQSLREKKYKLELKLKEYDKAITTIDSLIVISPEDIDNRIVQGILLEITGNVAQSINVFEETLTIINKKIKRMHPDAREKKLKRQINRLFVLKLLNRDSESDYLELENSELALDFPATAKVITIIKLGDREQIINNYR